MPMSPRLLRPKPQVADVSGPEQDPPVQLKTESNVVIAAESGEQLTTE